MKGILSIVVAGALFAGSANAELMEFDLESEGDGLVTLDTNSGLMWLDLTVTGGKSISQVKGMLANGELEGWRLPTAQDVYDLALSTFSALDDTSGTYLYLPTAAEDVEQFSLMGQNSGAYTYGQYEIDGEGTYLLGAFPNKVTINYQLDRYYNTQNNDSQDVNRIYDGVFLVSTNYDMAISGSEIKNISDVPAPLAFASLALMGMLTGRRKQQ
tara:strand:- start:2022 stop:2663 length:642 start_codon:yes stop_codon:yes gene_type:complete